MTNITLFATWHGSLFTDMHNVWMNDYGTGTFVNYREFIEYCLVNNITRLLYPGLYSGIMIT